MKNKLKYVVLVIGLLSVTNTLQAANYYVGLKGDDNNSGTSPGQAWKNISKVNETQFSAGDGIFFEGGQVFSVRFRRWWKIKASYYYWIIWQRTCDYQFRTGPWPSCSQL